MNLQTNVLSFFRRTPQTPEQIAERWVRKELSGYPASILAQAVSRAKRLIDAGKEWPIAADRAVKWARCAEHDVPSLTA